MRSRLIITLIFAFAGERIDSFTPINILSSRPIISSTRKRWKSSSNKEKNEIGLFKVPVLHQQKASRSNDEKLVKNNTAIQILNAAFLVSGTTIGGGFLALPSVVAPSGFFPSAASLVGVWVYFLAQSFVLVECIIRARSNNVDQTSEVQGIAATAKSVFGLKGEITVSVLLVILIQATLVSQISRAGMMFPNYRVGCLLSALSIAAIVFGPKSGIIFASKANALITSLFLLSAFTVFGFGIPIADWSRLSVSNNWSSVPSALPTFLQLLVYGEIVPSVCQYLKYNTKHIHYAIIFGSLTTLLLQVGWSGLGLSLVSSSVTVDPVSILLESSGPVQIPLFCLALTAILTTILGSYLALLSTVKDFLGRKKNQVDSKPYSKSISQRVKVASIITIPASLIACTSPSVFLKAIDFAGSYPVLLLWGVIPPCTALVQRLKESKSSKDGEVGSSVLNTSGPSAWLTLLASISLSLVGGNLFEDVSGFLKVVL